MSEIAISDSRDLATIDEEQLVTMMVDGQAFGIPILVVQDIVEPDQITPVPLAPGAIAGVLNLRGRIVTVIDMRELLRAEPFEDGAKKMSVTVEYKGDLYTFLVDSIGDVRSLPRKSFDKPPSTLSENLRSLCSGVFRLEDDLLVVLDVDRMLEEETIMKTPRRTRKRSQVNIADSANENATKVDDSDEEAAVKKPKGTSINSSDKQDKKSGAKTKPAKSKPVPKVEKNPAPKPAATPKPKAEKPATYATVGDGDHQAMQAVELFSAKIESNHVLNDLFSSVNDSDMLDLLVNLFNAAYGVAGAPSLEDAYLKFIKQPGLGDDHYMSSGTEIHATFMELNTDSAIVDRMMQVIDATRGKVLEI